MLTLASGPAKWANATDLWNMAERCSTGKSFHCLRARVLDLHLSAGRVVWAVLPSPLRRSVQA